MYEVIFTGTDINKDMYKNMEGYASVKVEKPDPTGAVYGVAKVPVHLHRKSTVFQIK